MKLKISAISDKGCVREHNEDMVLIGDHIFRDDYKKISIDLDEKENKFFVAVADGMGGHNAGEVASEIVLNKMAERIRTLKNATDIPDLKEMVTNWVHHIHNFILAEGINDPHKKGMGSTLIGILFCNERAFFINVGDSRLYRFRRGNLMQISRDHSLKEALGDDSVDSNIIVNSFGGGEKIYMDFEPVGGKILNGDTLLLCSDGLSDELEDDEIEQILERENPVGNLLKVAKDKGGKDNISFVLINIFEDPKDSSETLKEKK